MVPETGASGALSMSGTADIMQGDGTSETQTPHCVSMDDHITDKQISNNIIYTKVFTHYAKFLTHPIHDLFINRHSMYTFLSKRSECL